MGETAAKCCRREESVAPHWCERTEFGQRVRWFDSFCQAIDSAGATSAAEGFSTA